MPCQYLQGSCVGHRLGTAISPRDNINTGYVDRTLDGPIATRALVAAGGKPLHAHPVPSRPCEIDRSEGAAQSWAA